jgi:methylaspartate ammonia-lyase
MGRLTPSVSRVRLPEPAPRVEHADDQAVCLKALDQKAQQSLECDTYSATDAAQRYPLHQQAFDQSSCVIRDEVLFKTVDKLPSAVVAGMMLFAVVNVPVFLVPE